MAGSGEATAAEIASQPALWRRALDVPPAELEKLPGPGRRVLGLGCGTSYYVLDAYARRRQELGCGLTRAAIASELDDPSEYDAVVYLSRSGTTAELLRVSPRFRGVVPTVAVCGVPESPLAAEVDALVDLSFADETSVVQTRFATTALLLLRRSLGEDLAALPAGAEASLAEAPVAPRDHLVFLGTGWTVGVAHEAALKCREAAGLHVESYPAGEYRHGPIAVAGPGSLVWSFAPLPPALRRAVEATGATVREAERDPLVELVAVHRLALAAARAKGLDPDAPPHLRRSVVDTDLAS